MPITLDNPVALWLLLVLPAIYLLGRGRLSILAPFRRRAILAVRLLSVSAVILALAGPSMPLTDAGMSVVFVLDESESVAASTRAADQEWVRRAVGQMRDGDRAAVVTFAGDSAVSKQLGDEKQFGLIPLGSEAGQGSNLSTSLALAAGLLPSTGYRKVVLISDGWDTAGGALQAARSLPAGTRLDVVPRPAMEGRPEIVVESVSTPSYVREGDSFDVSAVVGTNHETSAQMSVSVDGRQTGGWTIQLAPGANLVTVPQKPLGVGFHSVRIQVSGGGDTVADNNRADGFVVVKEKGRVLMISGQPAGGALKQQLDRSGLKVDEVGTADIPPRMPDLLQYDSVVLNDVSGRSLSLDQMRMLEVFVKDHGRGLFVVGGLNSYGLGDYSSRLLEDVLPVSSDSPLTKERGDMALLLIVDRSGSMDEASGGVTKMAMAREAASQAIGALKPDDQIGVIAFDTDPTWVVPMTQAGTNLDDYRFRISRLQASGGTDIYTALQTGYDAIRGVQATQKHVILLTDGQSWKGPYQTLLQKMKQDQITLSTIAIGADADTTWLSDLARMGEGRYYFTSQFTDLPRIVFREVSAATRVSKVEGQIEPRLTLPSPLLRGLDGARLPALGGYVATREKDAATTVLKSDRGDPLLAQWQYGLGRVVAWTSDAEGLWSSSWLAQPEVSRVWEQAVRWSMPTPIDRTLRVKAVTEGARATITVDSVDPDGLFINLADTQAQVTDPEGRRAVVRLEQVAAGRYEAAVPATKPGLYRVDISQERGGPTRALESAGFAVPAAPEFRRLGSNEALLKQMGALTGGRAVADPSEVFSREGLPPSSGWQPLWGHLLALALLLLPFEVALRRIRALPLGGGGATAEEAEGRGRVSEVRPAGRQDRAA